MPDVIAAIPDFRRQILRTMLVVSTCFLCLFTLIGFINSNLISLLFITVAFTLNVVIWLLMRSYQAQFASRLFIFMLWALVSLIAVTRTGVFTPVLTTYSAIIVMAVFMLKEAEAIFVALLSIFTIMLLGFAQAQGILVLSLRTQTILSATAVHLFIISLVTLTVMLTARQIRLMLAALQASQQQQVELALAKEKNAFMAEFLANISHDLKTPLAVINTNLYLIEKLNDLERQPEKLQRIQEQTQLVSSFIEDILTVSRLEYLPDLELTSIDVNSLLRNIERQLRPRAEQKHIQLALQLEDTLPHITGDSQQLFRAFMNLIENAIHYTEDAGFITISSRSEQQYAVIVIKDTGIGIASEDIPHIFERFYRAKAARERAKSGTGLGLAIVQKIIEKHAGEIRVQSCLNEGTIFRVSLSIS